MAWVHHDEGATGSYLLWGTVLKVWLPLTIQKVITEIADPIYTYVTPLQTSLWIWTFIFFYDNCKADLTINLKAISTKFSNYLKYSGQIRFKKKKEPTSSREMSNNLILKAPSMNTKVVEYCFNMELNENICF